VYIHLCMITTLSDVGIQDGIQDYHKWTSFWTMLW